MINIQSSGWRFKRERESLCLDRHSKQIGEELLGVGMGEFEVTPTHRDYIDGMIEKRHI